MKKKLKAEQRDTAEDTVRDIKDKQMKKCLKGLKRK